jgi:hypothetical protein
MTALGQPPDEDSPKAEPTAEELAGAARARRILYLCMALGVSLPFLLLLFVRR